MNDAEDDPRERAIGWMIRLRDDAPAEDWQAFTLWLEADPANNAAYEAIAEADLLCGPAPGSAAPDTGAVIPPAAANDPEPAPRWRRGGSVAIAAAALAAGFAGFLLLTPRAAPDVLVTRPGEHRAIALADGSRIDLNGGSRLILPAGAGRRAELATGEATFDIRHDAGRPFQLAAGNTVIRDVGTVFDVVRADGATQIAVGSGRVIVNPDRDAVALGAGDGLIAADATGSVERRAVPAGSVGNWRRGQLIFDDAPLAAVASQLTRTTGIPIAVDPDLASRSFTGLIVVDPDRAAFSRKLGPLLGIEIVRRRAGWHWRAGAPSGN